MKRAKYINSESVEIIDFEETISTIEKNYNDMLKRNHITDSEVELIKNNTDEKSLSLLRLRNLFDEDKTEEIKRFNSYLEFVPCEKNELPEYSVRKIYYEKVENKIYEREIIIPNDKYVIQAKIEELKKKIALTDYVIIKSYESKISLEDAPYTQEEIEKIIQERKEIRNEINKLEDLLM